MKWVSGIIWSISIYITIWIALGLFLFMRQFSAQASYEKPVELL